MGVPMCTNVETSLDINYQAAADITGNGNCISSRGVGFQHLNEQVKEAQHIIELHVIAH